MRQPLVALVLSVLAAAASAQTVYRCGSTYSHTPCEGATSVGAAQPAARADAQHAAAHAQRDAKLAAEMEKARLAQEARAPKAVILPDRQAEAAAAAAKKEDTPERKLAKGEKFKYFTAVGPKTVAHTPKKKKKSS